MKAMLSKKVIGSVLAVLIAVCIGLPLTPLVFGATVGVVIPDKDAMRTQMCNYPDKVMAALEASLNQASMDRLVALIFPPSTDAEKLDALARIKKLADRIGVTTISDSATAEIAKIPVVDSGSLGGATKPTP